jgi:hypothetical protein
LNPPYYYQDQLFCQYLKKKIKWQMLEEKNTKTRRRIRKILEEELEEDGKLSLLLTSRKLFFSIIIRGGNTLPLFVFFFLIYFFHLLFIILCCPITSIIFSIIKSFWFKISIESSKMFLSQIMFNVFSYFLAFLFVKLIHYQSNLIPFSNLN